MAKVRERGPNKTICPSEVARALGGEGWRELMAVVRSQAQQLVSTGHIVVTQRGKVVDPAIVKGPVRYRLPDSKTSG